VETFSSPAFIASSMHCWRSGDAPLMSKALPGPIPDWAMTAAMALSFLSFRNVQVHSVQVGRRSCPLDTGGP